MLRFRRIFPILILGATLAFAAKPTAALLDLNTATPQELKSLPGMGEVYVRRIIAGRPYTAKNQLVTRGVIPQSAYEKISSRIIAKRPAR